MRIRLISRSDALLLVCALFLGGCGGSGDKGAAGTCVVCPNYGQGGVGLEGETCSDTKNCKCGLSCTSGKCTPYAGKFRGCKCIPACPRDMFVPGDQGRPDLPVLSDYELLPRKEGFVYLDRAIVKSKPGCLDDSSEPNNSGATATTLIHTGLITGWEICYRGDVDQYTLKVGSGKKLTVKIKFTHSKGDLDAALVLPDGYVQPSRSETDDEILSDTNTTSSTVKYTLGVWGANFDTNTYDLDIQIQ